jgi:hypothetical protein
MASTRSAYDACSYAQSLNESVRPLYFWLDPVKYVHCQPCRVDFGIVGGNESSRIAGDWVQLESDLRGQTRPLSRCVGAQYHPRRDLDVIRGGPDYLQCGRVQPDIDVRLKHLPDCSMFPLPPRMPAPRFSQPSCSGPLPARARAPLAWSDQRGAWSEGGGVGVGSA